MKRVLVNGIVVFGAAIGLAGCCGEDFGKVMEAAQGGLTMVNEMQNARQAVAAKEAGCAQAFFVTPEGIKKFMKLVAPDDKQTHEQLDELDVNFLSCVVPAKKKKSFCDDIAKAVVDSGKQKRKFGVTVTKQGQNDKPFCDGLYSKTGKHLGSIPKDQKDAFKNMNRRTTRTTL